LNIAAQKFIFTLVKIAMGWGNVPPVPPMDPSLQLNHFV